MIDMARVNCGGTNFLSNIPPPAFHFKWGVGQGSKAPEGKMWDGLEFLLGAKTKRLLVLHLQFGRMTNTSDGGMDGVWGFALQNKNASFQ